MTIIPIGCGGDWYPASGEGRDWTSAAEHEGRARAVTAPHPGDHAILDCLDIAVDRLERRHVVVRDEVENSVKDIVLAM